MTWATTAQTRAWRPTCCSSGASHPCGTSTGGCGSAGGLFPKPVCGTCDASCDYLDGCERSGHYTGFRTAAESRAIREGLFYKES
mmetsp:Transcript_16925/g.34193  ORF Transcript_16925/g.34193 Transcript_16925/m.34193 type:complete len:85 (+) Transcript_16925:107-361(+)